MSAFTQQILEDIESLPPEMQTEALDFVRFLKSRQARIEAGSKSQAANSSEAAAIMAEIAARGTAFQNIDDPVAWQKDLRQDGSLPEETDVAGQ